MKPRIRNVLLLLLMAATSALAVVLKPTDRIADHGPAVQLESMIPRQFGNWRQEERFSAQMVDPQQKEMIDKLYSQTLSRSYVNEAGYLIMLSIAYGGDQRDSMQVHKPEICYPAQGFSLLNEEKGTLGTGSGKIPVVRIVASMGSRREPVTYWTTIGDRLVKGGFEKKLIEISYGLTGRIPDGLLFRVSSIDSSDTTAFAMQEKFVNQLLEVSSPETRKRLAGLGASNESKP